MRKKKKEELLTLFEKKYINFFALKFIMKNL